MNRGIKINPLKGNYFVFFSYAYLFYPVRGRDVKARSPLPMGRIEGSAVSLPGGDRVG